MIADLQAAAIGTEVLRWTAPPVTRTQIVRFQGASGDFDPAHHDDAHAQTFGYPSVFSLGMLHAGVMMGRLSTVLPVGGVRSFALRFRGVVFPGDIITYTASIHGFFQSEEGSQLAKLALMCVKADQSLVIEGRADVVV